tara:strand:- start:3488 stop:4813 length:1326 start_codon:yes stop_codon:yes gene_type:complete
VIKNFKIEIIILALLLISIFVSYKLDIGFYIYFNTINNSLETVYLKQFFTNITSLGDSLWYFSLCFFGLLLIFIFSKLRIITDKIFNDLKNLLYYLFVSLLVTGFITQVLKHVVGRPRPNYTNMDEAFGFDFFSTSSNFHSFPSGHSSTIFILALVLSTAVPKLRYLFLFFASVVAFSRVVVGAHFFTDIIGGVVVAFISYKLINLFFNKKLKKPLPKKIDFIDENLFFLFALALFILAIFLTVGSAFDLFFSSLFYKGDNQFLLQSFYTITLFFRKIVLPTILVYVLFLPLISKIIPIKKLFFGYSFVFKDIIYIWSNALVSLVVVINLIFKTFWGRARPGDVLQLGGEGSFSPWYQISDACSSNCSFVSGDAAVGFSLVVLYFITKNSYYLYSSIVFGFLLGIIRIAEGGHFLSDIIFSGIIVFLITYVFSKFFFSKTK